MTRRSFQRPVFLTLFSSVFAVLLAAEAVLAAVVRQPYLQLLTPTSVTIVWRTDLASPSGSRRVQHGTVQGSLAQTTNATTVTPASNPNVRDHIATISGLTPGTKYFYSVGTSSLVEAGGTADHFFVAAPATGSSSAFRVWALGDSGDGSTRQTAVRNAMQTFTSGNPPDVVLHLGDIAYESGTDSEFTTKHFGVYQNIFRNTVSWPTFGNHEAVSSSSSLETGPYFEGHVLPTSAQAGGVASGTEAYYSFNYGNVHFVVLDSEGTSLAPGSAMLNWLQNDLTATQQPWIVAVFHHPSYTRGSHSSDDAADSGARMVKIRENVVPILEAGGVDLVLSGHSHGYERSYFINSAYGYGTSPNFATPDFSTLWLNGDIIDETNGNPTGSGPYVKDPGVNQGAVYVVAGNGGKPSFGTGGHPVMVSEDLTSNGSILLDVNGTVLTVRAIRSNGTVTDVFSIDKSSAFGPANKIVITQPGADFEQGGDTALQVSVQDSAGNRIITDNTTRITFDPTLNARVQAVVAGTLISPTSLPAAIGAPVTVRVASGVATIRLTDNVAETFQVVITNTVSLNNPPNDTIAVAAAGPTITREAESGTLTAPMVIRSDPLASGGQYVEAPQGAGNNSNDATNGGPGEVNFAINIVQAATYALWARVLTPNTHSDAFYVTGNGTLIREWNIGVNTTWIWKKVAETVLSPGLFNLAFRQRDDASRLDQIILTRDLNFVPGTSGSPTITSIVPNSGPVAGGQTGVVINGTNLSGATSVTFGGTAATITGNTSTTITVTTPAHAQGAVDVVATVSAGTATSTGGYAYTAPAAPSISNLNPTSGPVGTVVTISGSNFGASQGTSTVRFNGTTATTSNWSNTSITATVPSGASTGNVVVTVGGTPSNGVLFTVTASPTITSIVPNSGPVAGGQTGVVINGTNLSGATSVTFGGTAATITGNTSTTITVTTPAHAQGAVDVVATVSAGTATSTGGYAYTAPAAPSISNLNPTSGPVGTVVTISGSNFGASQGTSTVRFNGTTATTSNWSNTSITATVPSGASTGNVVVTVGGTPSNGVLFTVTQAGETITLEAESGSLTAPMVIRSDSLASGGQYVEAPQGAGNNTNDATNGGPGQVNFAINIVQAATYALWARVLTPNTHSDAFYVTGNGTLIREWNIGVNITWIWKKVAETVLSPGLFNLAFRQRDDASRLDQIVVTRDLSFVPGGSSSPAISNLNPTSGPVGTTVVITGSNFGATGGTSTVTFNGTSATPSNWSSTSITVPVPSGATTGNVVVTVGGTPSNGVLFTLQAELVVAYGFEEGSGTTTQDWSGNDNHGTLINGTDREAGQIGLAVSFDGTNDYVETSNATDLPTWTISAWVMSPGAPTNAPQSGPIRRGTNYQINWNHTDEAFRGAAAVRVDGTWHTASFGELLGNEWYYLAATYDGERLRTYKDGLLVTTNETPSGSPGIESATLTLGGTPEAPGFFEGIVDELRVYDGVLSQAEVADDMTTPVAPAVAPSISNLNPTSGPVATVVTISGSNFGASQGASTVRFNGTIATPTDWSNTSITVPVPSGASTGNVVVTVGGTPSNGVLFTVTASPTITSIVPNSGPVAGGQTGVVINGTNLSGATSITFGGTAATITGNTSTTITVTTPAHAQGAVDVVATVSAGTATSTGGYAYTAPAAPSISNLNPTSGPVGTVVTISGSNFGASQGTSTVRFNGTTATTSNWSNTSITATVPSGASTGNVVVTVGGTPSNGVLFTVTASPTITSIVPNSGPVAGGQTGVVINGTNLSGATSVTFGGTAATITGNTSTTITVTTPAHAQGAVDVVATVSAGTATSTGGYAYTAPAAPSISDLNPTSGPVGTVVTISGSNFGASEGTSTVTFNGTAANPTNWSSTTITVPVPSGATTGNVVVTVERTPSNGVLFTVTGSTVTITLEAESGTRTAPMVIASDTQASGGQYVEAPQGTGVNINDATNGGPGEVNFAIDIAQAGTYALWARTLTPNTHSDSFYVTGNGTLIREWNIALSTTWVWRKVADVVLPEGVFNLAFRQREDGARLDQVILTQDLSLIPTN